MFQEDHQGIDGIYAWSTTLTCITSHRWWWESVIALEYQQTKISHMWFTRAILGAKRPLQLTIVRLILNLFSLASLPIHALTHTWALCRGTGPGPRRAPRCCASTRSSRSKTWQQFLKGQSYHFQPRLKIPLRPSLVTSLAWDINVYLLKRVTAKTDTWPGYY